MSKALSDILEGLVVIIWSALKFVVGLVNATVLFDMGFIPSVLLTVAGGMVGVYVFALLDKTLIRLWHKYIKKKSTKVKFTGFKRWIVRIRAKYGVAGIAFLTPIVLQVPIGTILAMRLIKDLRKVSVYMLLSFTFFSLLFCGLYYGLDAHFKEVVERVFKH